MLDVKQFRESRGITSKDMVDVAREQYPKYDKHLQSKLERPHEYGIRPLLALESAWEAAFSTTTPTCTKRDNRKLKARIQCRLTEREYAQLQRKFRVNGFDTMQDGIKYIIGKYLEETQNDAV